MTKFNTLGAAQRFHENCQQYSKYAVVMGDDNLYWFVTVREACKLIKQGYELAY